MKLKNWEEVRDLMLEEIDHDLKAGSLYLSRRLTEQGREEYPSLLAAAAQVHDIEWLGAALCRRGLIKYKEMRNTRSGATEVNVPSNAAEMLAEGEGNRFYIRAVCRLAIERGTAEVVIYRAKTVNSPRPGSEERIGKSIGAVKLLDDLRVNVGIETALMIPGGPNSGISICLS